ncbi:MAG: hypothetical protein AB7N91_17530 [Candidatus Tectimicrobiota bacterium]
MRHNVWRQLLGSACLAWLSGWLLDWETGSIGVAFVIITAAWGCTTSLGDAWHRWQTQGDLLLALALLWNIGMAVLVWLLHTSAWSLGSSLVVLLAYTILPWGLGRLLWSGLKHWQSKAAPRRDTLV